MDIIKILVFVIFIIASVYSESRKGKKQAQEAAQRAAANGVEQPEDEDLTEILRRRQTEQQPQRQTVRQPQPHKPRTEPITPLGRSVAQEGGRISTDMPQQVVLQENTEPQLTADDVRRAIVLEAVMNRVEW